jgi:alkylation response protein AidB-like acyl-CoA dehydrogenase
MNLELSEDQRELWAVARRMLGDVAPMRLAREFLDGGGDARPLAASLAELGWYAVGADEDSFGVPGLCLLAEQIGAHAAPTTLVDTAVAVRLAQAIEDPSPLVSAVAAGEVATALAVLEDGANWRFDDQDLGVCRTAAGYVLDGVKLGVQHGATVDALAVVATYEGSPAVFFVPAGDPGISVAAEAGLDPASAPATVTLASCAVEPGRALVGDHAVASLEGGFAVGAVATAAEGLGAATAALKLAVAHAKERHQFGRPIGQFQALQHVLADAHVDRESAWSSVLYAAAALEERLPDGREASSIAKAYASSASRTVVEASLQVLGGIAFTWEHDVHLLQRRVLSCERRFGDAISHERLLADRLAAGSLEMVG